ncbi:MAG: oligosaccharide flippase family protein [Dermatophilaceae bacterium]
MRRGLAAGSRAASAGAFVGGSLIFANAMSYVFTLVAARRMGPAEYGVLAAMMSLFLIVNVAAMGLQTAAARRLAVAPERVRAMGRIVGWSAAGTGLAVALACVAATPPLVSSLRLDSPALVLLLACAALLLALMGGQLGVLQGTEHWHSFAMVYVVFGVTRLLCGWLGLALVGGATGAFGGVVLGTALTVLAGSVSARARASHGPDSHPPSRRAIRSLLVESGHAMTLLFAFFALSSADVLLARATLDAHDAGLYAAGQILAKSVLFLPSFVSVVAFPRLARGGRRKLHLAGLAVVLGIGLVVVLGTVAFPGLALTLVGGASYAQTGQSLWEFAALGAVLAGIQLLVTTALARRHTRAAWVVWVALAFIAAAGLASDTWTALLHWVLAIDVLLLLALVALTWRDRFTAGELSEQP